MLLVQEHQVLLNMENLISIALSEVAEPLRLKKHDVSRNDAHIGQCKTPKFLKAWFKLYANKGLHLATMLFSIHVCRSRMNIGLLRFLLFALSIKMLISTQQNMK